MRGTTLVLGAELKLEWGREKYIDNLDGEDRGANTWLSLGGWIVIHARS